MAKQKTKTESQKEPQPSKLPRKEYVLINPVKIKGKQYNRKDKIKLTEKGAAYFKSIHKIN